jgi:hypothetical protein
MTSNSLWHEELAYITRAPLTYFPPPCYTASMMKPKRPTVPSPFSLARVCRAPGASGSVFTGFIPPPPPPLDPKRRAPEKNQIDASPPLAPGAAIRSGTKTPRPYIPRPRSCIGLIHSYIKTIHSYPGIPHSWIETNRSYIRIPRSYTETTHSHTATPYFYIPTARSGPGIRKEVRYG